MLQDFVSIKLGQRFIEPQTAELGLVFKDSSTTTPLIFVLSAGTDPAADLYKFAEEVSMSSYLNCNTVCTYICMYLNCIHNLFIMAFSPLADEIS